MILTCCEYETHKFTLDVIYINGDTETLVYKEFSSTKPKLTLKVRSDTAPYICSRIGQSARSSVVTVGVRRFQIVKYEKIKTE